MSELRLYCDLLMQQVHTIQESVEQEGESTVAITEVRHLTQLFFIQTTVIIAIIADRWLWYKKVIIIEINSFKLIRHIFCCFVLDEERGVLITECHLWNLHQNTGRMYENC